MHHHETGARQKIDKILVVKDSQTWKNSLSNKFGRLDQGVGKHRPTDQHVTGINTIIFILRNKVPYDAR